MRRPPDSPERLSLLLVAAVVLGAGAIVAAVHWPVLACQALCIDDVTFLFKNPAFQNPGWGTALQFIREVTHSSTIEGYYEPLTLISLMLDVLGGGRWHQLYPFHRTSLLLHVINVMLLVVLLYLLFREPISAGLVGLLFGLHPLSVEPVAWVWERKTPLATCFALASLILYVQHARRPRRWVLAASAIMLLLSLMSKPTGVMLSVVMILLDVWPLRRFGRRTLLEKVPFLALSAAGAAVTLASTAHTSYVVMPWERSIGNTLLRVVYLPAFYLGKLIWPASLTPVYQLPSPFSLTNPTVAVAVGATAVAVMLVVLSLRWSRAPMVGALAALLLISPTLGVVGYTWVVASDKYAYLPMIGLLLPLAGGLAWLREKLARRLGMGWAVAVPVLVGLALAGIEARATRAQLALWSTTETLGRHVVRLAPESHQGYLLLAGSIVDPGRVQEAMALYEQVIRLDPKEAVAHLALAEILAGQNRTAEAIEHYRAAFATYPDDADKARAYRELGREFSRKGLYEAAAVMFRESLTIEPDAGTWNALGNALSNLKRPAEAAVAFSEALRLQPDYPAALNNLGNAQFDLGRTREAIASYRKALELKRDYALARANLADALLKAVAEGLVPPATGAEALQHYREAVRLEPANAGFRVRLGEALERSGDLPAAAAEYRQALRLNPRHARAAQKLEALSTLPAERGTRSETTGPQ